MARNKNNSQPHIKKNTNSDNVSNSSPVFEDISSGKVDKDDNFIHECKSNDTANPQTESYSSKINNFIKDSRIKKSKFISTFNNEEPILFALKKISFELFIIFIFVLSFLLILGGIQFGFSKLGNDSIENLAASSLYHGTVSVKDVPVTSSNETDQPDAIVNALAKWYGEKTSNEDFSPLPFIFKSQFDELLTKNNVSMQTNIANYSLLTQIYTSLQQGNPVVVILSTDKAISYAIVTSLDSENSLITLTHTDGTSDTMTLDNFLLATRHNNESDLSSTQKFLKFLGVYKVNTAFFINEIE